MMKIFKSLFIFKILTLGLTLLFLSFYPAIAEESAIFSSHLPPGPIRAGEVLIFNLSITNTGTNIWISGKILVSVKIYNSNKEYLTETDKVRWMDEVEPGEVISIKIDFDVPLDYAGIYYYTVNVEIEEETTLKSRYFRFQVQPFSPEPEEKISSKGNLSMSYQTSARSTPTSNFSLSLVNRNPGGYSKLSLSGKDPGLKSSQISTFTIMNTYLIGGDEDKLELLIGDTSSALSSLTLGKFRGLKAQLTSGKTSIAGLVGINQDASSARLSQQPDVYGVKMSTEIRENLLIGVNFIGKIKSEATGPVSEVTSNANSTLSIQMDYDLSPNFSFLGEYAWNFLNEDILKYLGKGSDALEVEGSFNTEKIYIEGSYKRLGENFSVPGNEGLKRDYLEYGVFVDYFLSPYLSMGLYYYTNITHPSDEADKLLTTTKSVDVSFYPPGLPLLTLTYDIDEMQGVIGGSEGFTVDDVTYTFYGAFSQQFKNIRFSLGYFFSHYEDRTQSGLEDNFSIMTYRISSKWWDRLFISATQKMEEKKTDEDKDERFSAFSLTMTYAIIPQKLSFSSSWKIDKEIKGEDNQTTTKTTLRYMLSRSNVLGCSYSLKNYGSFTNLDTLISNEASIDLGWKFDFGRNQSLDVSYIFTVNKDFIQKKTSDTSSINLTYNYSF